MAWQSIRLDSAESTTRALAALEASGSDLETIYPQQDLNWFLDGKDSNPDLYLYFYEDENHNKGTCLLRRHYRPVKLSVGEFVVHQRPVYRFELCSSPLVQANSDAERERILSDLLAVVGPNLKRNEALSVEGLQTDSLFFKLLSRPNGAGIILQLGKAFMRQSIVFPATYDEYLGQMSKRSRKSVQYSERKLAKDFDTQLFECSSPELVGQFLDDAIAVSKKTYQWNLLGLGLRDKDVFEAILKHWDRQADLRCFLLYCNAVPTAFMLGYVYKSCYYYIDVGYDPDWAKYSVGSVLQLLVIKRLYEMAVPPTLFDFSTGYGEHKGRFGNTQREEVNVLVFPANLRNRSFRLWYRFVDGTGTGLVALLDRFGIKKKLKKIIRRSSGPRS